MNNEHKGEVSFEVNGRTYMLRRSWNSICELEGLTGKGFYALSQELAAWGPPTDDHGKPIEETAEQVARRTARVSGTTLRAVFCSLLRDQTPDMSLRQAGELMNDIGLGKVMELVQRAFEASDAKAEAGGQGQEIHPTNGQAGPARAST